MCMPNTDFTECEHIYSKVLVVVVGFSYACCTQLRNIFMAFIKTVRVCIHDVVVVHILTIYYHIYVAHITHHIIFAHSIQFSFFFCDFQSQYRVCTLYSVHYAWHEDRYQRITCQFTLPFSLLREFIIFAHFVFLHYTSCATCGPN